MGKLLLDEYPLLVLPQLATRVGLNEAIILQQVHYWLQNPKMGRWADDKHWIKNSLREWKTDNFPFFSMDTIKRAFASLRKSGVILVRSDLNSTHTDRTFWYSIDYAVLHNALGQNAPMEKGILHPSLSETTTETTPSNEFEGKRRQAAPSFSTNGKLSDPPTGYLWIASSISTEKHIHLAGSEKGKLLCGASLKHRTTDYQHTGASTPCPECLKAAEKPKSKMEQPPQEVKDRFAQICFGQAKDLTPASWGLIVKAWNQMGKPDVAELKTLEDAWYKQDWRGKRGERPKPLQLAAERDSLKAKSVKREHYGVQLTAAQQEMYAKFPILEKFPASEWSWRVREQNFK